MGRLVRWTDGALRHEVSMKVPLMQIAAVPRQAAELCRVFPKPVVTLVILRKVIGLFLISEEDAASGIFVRDDTPKFGEICCINFWAPWVDRNMRISILYRSSLAVDSGMPKGDRPDRGIYFTVPEGVPFAPLSLRYLWRPNFFVCYCHIYDGSRHSQLRK